MTAELSSHITVVGSINIDFSVTSDRLPQPGESVVGHEFLRAFGGKGANQAVGIARLTDRPVRFIGAVGDDELGNAGIDSLQENGVDTQLVQSVSGVSTGVALIMVDECGENCISAAPGANAKVDPDYIHGLADDVFRSSSLLVLCQEIPVESLEVLVKRADSFQLPVLFNPAPPNPRLTSFNVLEHVDYLTPNETETAAITGLDVEILATTEGRVKALKELTDHTKGSIAITLGKAGCFVYDRAEMESVEEGIQVEAPTVDSVDTTAAGDSFNAALAVALTEGKNFVDACRWANRCAAISVTRRGAQPSLPARAELPFENK